MFNSFLYLQLLYFFRHYAQQVKNLPAMQETPVHFLGLGRSPEEGLGYPLQYSWASLVVQRVNNLPEMRET